jgi:hypothetical protein
MDMEILRSPLRVDRGWEVFDGTRIPRGSRSHIDAGEEICQWDEPE